MEQKRAEFQKETLETDGSGNPHLVYLSKFVEGWEPSGVPVRTIPRRMTPHIVLTFDSLITKDAIEVSRCTGVEAYTSS